MRLRAVIVLLAMVPAALLLATLAVPARAAERALVLDVDGAIENKTDESGASETRKIVNDAQKLVEAARILAEVPQAMQLRYLGTLFDIASERGSTIVFPFPIELVNALSALAPKGS